ncbi:YitT family protein [Paenibacillus rhizoplanae]
MSLPLRLAIILTGTLLLAFTYYHINYQNHLTEGGFVGLSLLGKYVLGISPSLSILILDIPVLIIAIIFQRKIIRSEHLHIRSGLHGVLRADGTLFRLGY